MPKVSVIIPIYNVEKFLRECLDSVINQTLKDIEIICINDESPDNSFEIIKEYANKDNRIKIIDKKNGGYGQSVNWGIREAKGDYIAVVEPDDYIDKNMYENLYNLAIENNADIVKSSYYENLDTEFYKKILKIGWDKEFNLPKNVFKIEEHPEFLFFHPSIWSCIYKKDFLVNNNIKVVEAKGAGWTDNPFQVETLVNAERIIYTNEAYYYWRKQNFVESDDLKDYTLPFVRSNEIHTFLEEQKNITIDMLACLYKRELAYIGIVLGIKNIKDKKDCFNRIKQMLARMDETVFKTSKYITKKDYKKYKLFKRNLKLAYTKAQFKNWRKRTISIRLTKNETSIRINNRLQKIKDKNE